MGIAYNNVYKMSCPFNPKKLTKEKFEVENAELQKVIKETGMKRPDRSTALAGENIKLWYGEKPDYTSADLHYLKTKSRNHPEGSLEQIVETTVKNVETELFHKTDPDQILLSDPKRFAAGLNSGPRCSMKEFMEKGSYNVLLDSPELDGINDAWKKNRSEVDSSFINAMKNFSWEVLDVFSPPPIVSFSWRHWGNFTGEWEGNKGKGQLIEVFGFSVCDITGGKLGRFDNYFDAKSFIEVLKGEKDASVLSKLNHETVYPQMMAKVDEITENVKDSQLKTLS